MADQDELDEARLRMINAALCDLSVCHAMLAFVACMAKQNHPTAKKILNRVMTYEIRPPEPVREYMELGDADLF